MARVGHAKGGCHETTIHQPAAVGHAGPGPHARPAWIGPAGDARSAVAADDPRLRGTHLHVAGVRVGPLLLRVGQAHGRRTPRRRALRLRPRTTDRRPPRHELPEHPLARTPQPRPQHAGLVPHSSPRDHWRDHPPRSQSVQRRGDWVLRRQWHRRRGPESQLGRRQSAQFQLLPGRH